MKKIYTDGACKKNPGKGGWAFIILENNEIINKGFGSKIDATNQQMELMAVIESLKKINQGEVVEVYSDSAYVVNCFNENWMDNWKKNGWVNAANKKVANKELWEELDELMTNKNVSYIKVKGHSGDKNNELVDKMATSASNLI